MPFLNYINLPVLALGLSFGLFSWRYAAARGLRPGLWQAATVQALVVAGLVVMALG